MDRRLIDACYLEGGASGDGFLRHPSQAGIPPIQAMIVDPFLLLDRYDRNA